MAPKMGKRMPPKGMGRPRDTMPPALRKAMMMNRTDAMMEENQGRPSKGPMRKPGKRRLGV